MKYGTYIVLFRKIYLSAIHVPLIITVRAYKNNREYGAGLQTSGDRVADELIHEYHSKIDIFPSSYKFHNL